jgi:hypothetical protein
MRLHSATHRRHLWARCNSALVPVHTIAQSLTNQTTSQSAGPGWNSDGIAMDDGMRFPFDAMVFHPAFGSADALSAWPRPLSCQQRPR